MQRNLTPLPLWMTVAAITLAVGIVTLLAFTLRRDSVADDANDRVQTSALLPDNWSTYGAEVWSVGYPNAWEIDSELLGTGGMTTARAISFHPADITDVDGDFVRVEKEFRALENIEESFAAMPSVTRSEFRFASYPAVKFSTSQRDEYYVSYNEDLYRITTDHPSLNEVSMMLVTFRFGD